MKKLILVLAIATLSPSLLGCSAPQHAAVQKNTINPTASPAEVISRDRSIPAGQSIAKQADTPASDVLTLQNDEWTIQIGNLEAWSGVNGTGNATYRGCDRQGNCLTLTGGKTSCRDGLCVTGWQNGEYRYAIKQIMDNPDAPREVGSRTTLVVRKGATEILRTSGFLSIAP